MGQFRLVYEFAVVVSKLTASTARALVRVFRGAQSQSWPQTEALVQAILCPADEGIAGVRVDYEYSVNQQYYGGCLSRECLTKFAAHWFAARFTVRACYMVRYDPNHPERSYLPAKPTMIRRAAVARSSFTA